MILIMPEVVNAIGELMAERAESGVMWHKADWTRRTDEAGLITPRMRWAF